MTTRAKDGSVGVGIDIGSCAVKILQVSKASGVPGITAIGSRSISGSTPAEISDLIKSLADEIKVSSREAAISVSGTSVIVRMISLPKMDDAALAGAMRFEAEKFIPYNINDCIVDFQVLKKDEKENKLSILLVAAKKDLVDERIGLMEKAGFSVRIVDIDSLAITNSFLACNKSADREKSYAVLNVGGTLTNLSIVKAGSVYFARDIAIGGNSFTSAIANKFSISQKDAEGMKVNPPEGKGLDMADCVKGAIGDLLDEIKLSFSYYENQLGKGIDEIYISGGSANIIGLDQAFEETLGSKPTPWDVIGCFDLTAAGSSAARVAAIRDSFAVAAGLALR